MKSLLKISIIIVFCFFLAISVSAQIPGSVDGLEISSSPASPNPGQNVTVRIESFVTDLNAASIVWVVAGKNEGQGTGMTSINITAPALGKTTTVVAAVLTAEGREIRKSIAIKSGSVDLIWESGGYVPPFYRGKALLAYENSIKITAVPHLAGSSGVELDPRTLIYKWKKNDKVAQEQSGYGKQSLTLQEDIPTSLDIEVEVNDKSGNQRGAASFSLQPGDPTIIFYEESPLYGVLYNKTLDNSVRLTNQEITLRAVPYTFNTRSPLNYLWSVNDLERPDLSTNQSITLRTKGDVEGSSAISLEIRGAEEILQGARKSINVLFSKKTEESNVTF